MFVPFHSQFVVSLRDQDSSAFENVVLTTMMVKAPKSMMDVNSLTTLWLFNIAMENCPFIDDFPINTSIYEGFSMAMLNNQMVLLLVVIRSRVQPKHSQSMVPNM